MPSQPIKILGVQVNKKSESEVLKQVREFFSSGNQHYLVTTNPEFIMAAQEDSEFREIINQADISIPDGIGLLWAARFLSLPAASNKLWRVFQAAGQVIYTGASLVFYPRYCRGVLPERISGTDLIRPLAQLCAQAGKSLYLLGGRLRVGGKTAAILQKEFPGLKIAGTYEGEALSAGDQKAHQRINKAQPDVLLVAYGHPKQEKWVARNLAKLPSVKIAMGVGGAYDFIAGKVQRAPKIIRSLGLEWLWRLIKQPQRVGRIFTATIKFIWAVYQEKVRRS
ncbi:WecB/TagA/CpsF family glycosyltransferase [Patescibacteria group bacterium]|nr:WecB/TagA/CpsF family glycosyltransferase [Patescibacteria group bacterium]